MSDEEPKIRRPWISVRVLLIAVFMLACFGVLGAKLYVEQVLRHNNWSARVRKSSNVTVRLPGVRGEILDRNGMVLVGNRTSYGVDFYLPQIVQGYREQHNNRVPLVAYRTKIDEMPKDVEVADVVQILNSSVIPRLSVLDAARDYPATQLDKHYRTNSEVPYSYLDDVDFETVARISEHDAALPGVEVVQRPVRWYIYGSLAAHVLGYVGGIEDIQKEPDISSFTYYQPDIVGRANVELYMDKFLRGKPGKRVLERTPKGKVGAEIERVLPTPGNDVYLTLDARIQMIVENTLREAEIGRGAAVVVNPSNGDILAMANVPNYDPNIFIPEISPEEMKVLDDDETDPLLNRCIQGYLPGSTYKVVTAFAGLRSGLPADKAYNCPGGIVYGTRRMKCWIAEQGTAHGSLQLSDAIKRSCNCYFFLQGNQAGLDHIEAVGEALGLGQKSGLPISGETAGILPGPKWLTAHGKEKLAESSGQIANTSIGQGMVLASPLQMAMVCSTVANGGISYYPRLVHRVVDTEKRDILGPDGRPVIPIEPRVRSDLRTLGLTAEEIEVVRRGMWKVVNEQGGTGGKARIKGVEVAGKTGTAQFKRKVGNELVKDNRVWFMSFAPYKQPKYVVVVMVEGAKSGGGVAAPIATKIMRGALALEAGAEPTVAALTPVAGNFENIEQVTLSEDGKLSRMVAAAFQGTDQRPGDDEVSTQNDDAPVESRVGSAIRPVVRASADERGRVVQPRAPKKPNIFQRLFGPKPPKSAPVPYGRPR